MKKKKILFTLSAKYGIIFMCIQRREKRLLINAFIRKRVKPFEIVF